MGVFSNKHLNKRMIGGTILADESKNQASLKMVEEFFEDIANHYVTDPEKRKEARCKLRIFEAFFEDLYSRTNRLENKLEEVLKNNEKIENILEKANNLGNDSDIENMKRDINTNNEKLYDVTAECNDIKRDIESNNNKINDIKRDVESKIDDMERKISSMETDVYNHGVDIGSIKENLGY